MLKKFFVTIIIAFTMVLAVACKPIPPTLSADASVTVTSISGHEVADNGITMTTAEWNVFAAVTDYKAVSVYTLADKATLDVTREAQSVIFVATAEDGKTTQTVTVTVTVLSDGTALTVSKIAGIDVENNAVTFTTAQWNLLSNTSDLKAQCEYTLADGASVAVSLDEKTFIFAVTAEDGETMQTVTVTVTVLSDDTTLTVSKIAGIDVENNAVTFTTAQWAAFSAETDLKAQCEYTLANNATLSVALSDKTLTFAITAQDGTTASQSIAITVLSNDTSFTVTKVGEKTVTDNKIELSASEWLELKNITDVKDMVEVTHHAGASYTVNFDADTSRLFYVVTAEDGTVATGDIPVAVEDVFGKYANGALGNDNGYVWSNQKGAYVSVGNGDSAYLVDETTTLKNTYAFSAEITLPALVLNGEIVMCAQVRPNKVIRFAVRATSATQIRVFSDYRDDTGFFNDTTHVAAHDYTAPVTMGIIVYGNDVAMLWNGETVYHRALDGIDASELKINGAYNMMAELRDIVAIDDEDTVASMYAQAMKDYHDPIVGQPLAGVNSPSTGSDLSMLVLDHETRSIDAPLRFYVPSQNRVRTAIYHNGNPFGGYVWAFKAHLKIQIKKDRSAGVRFWAYEDAYNCLKYAVIRQPKGTSMPEANSVWSEGWEDPLKANSTSSIKNGPIGKVNGLAVGSTDANGLNTYETDIILIYDHGYYGFVIENTLWYSYQLDYGYVGLVVDFQSPSHSNLSNMEFITDKTEVEKLRLTWDTETQKQDLLVQNDVFVQEGISFVKNSNEYATVALKGTDGMQKFSDTFSTHLKMRIDDPEEWGQAELKMLNASGNGVRVVLEYLLGGTYQLFAQTVIGGVDAEWKLLEANIKKVIPIDVSCVGGKLYLSVRGDLYATYDVEGPIALSIGGKGGTVSFREFATITDQTEVESFVNGLENYGNSLYRGRAKQFVKDFAGKTGHVVLVGDSTFDHWRARKDGYGNAIAGYYTELSGILDENGDGLSDVLNFGIGGSCWSDWLALYPALVKDFAPSKLVLVCGTNDFVAGRSAEAVFEDFTTFMSMLRKDFPTMPVYVLHSLPSPKRFYMYDSYHAIYKQKINEYALSDANLFTIDMYTNLVGDDGIITSFYDTDNGHLNSAGYALLGDKLREALGL